MTPPAQSSVTRATTPASRARTVLRTLLVMSVLVVLTACAGQKPLAAGEARMPSGSDDFVGEQYEAVVQTIETAGFTNVTTVALGDLITGWIDKPGEVKEVEIGGVTSFGAGDVFANSVSVVISYHSFPAEEQSPSPTPTTAPVLDILTVENSPELAALLVVGDTCSSSITDFSNKYRGRTISFDGNIAYMQPHADTKTRFDLLVYAGDYDLDHPGPSPSFVIQDVNMVYDMHFDGPNVPEYINAGLNIRITAEIGEFNSTGCIFPLKPIETLVR